MMETIVAHAGNKERCSRDQADDFDAYPAPPYGSLLLYSGPNSLAPSQRLIAIQMIQTPTGSNSAYRHALRNLAYAAMTGSEPAR
jgi:hypothetical protein